MPQVSVIIPTYNRKEYLQLAIESVLGQTYDDYEIIVVDDGSSDGTGAAIEARYGERVRYLWQENQGESVARNRGIELAQGDYLALLDSDDLWLPTKLARQVYAMDSDPIAVLTFALSWTVDGEGQVVDMPSLHQAGEEPDLSLESLYLKNPIYGASTVMMRRAAVVEVGAFDRAIRYGEDWDLWLRLRQQGSFLFLNEPLTFVRRHANAQHHFPSPERAERELADRLYMLEKAFATGPAQLPAELKARAMANQVGQAALLNYAIGKEEVGRRLLAEAAELYGRDWGNPRRLALRLTRYALKLGGTGSQGRGEPGVSFLQALFAHWPNTIPVSKRWQRQLLSTVYAQMASQSLEAGNRWHARNAFVRALRIDLGWLKNAELRASLMKTALGFDAARHWRSSQ